MAAVLIAPLIAPLATIASTALWCAAGAHVLNRLHHAGFLRDGVLGLGLLTALVLAMPGFLTGAVAGTDPGGFSTLTVSAQFGLAALSVSLAALACAANGLKSRWLSNRLSPYWHRLAIDLPLTAVLAVIAVELSFQIFYAYYQIVIPGLPAQWVIGLPDIGRLLADMAVWSDAGLGARLRGATIWVLLVQTALAGHGYRPPGRAALLGAGVAAGLHGARVLLAG